jgi:hypothetical protein
MSSNSPFQHALTIDLQRATDKNLSGFLKRCKATKILVSLQNENFGAVLSVKCKYDSSKQDDLLCTQTRVEIWCLGGIGELPYQVESEMVGEACDQQDR